MRKKQSILVTGGAGYIGSHVAFFLYKQGYKIIILDNYSQGQEALPFPAEIVHGDYGNAELLHTIFTTHSVQAVVHCAAAAVVGASVADPLFYYQNNVAQMVALLECMVQHNVLRCIFSSSCAVYGTPQTELLNEQHPCNPVNPYGSTKLMGEQLLKDAQKAYGLEYIALRYFNAYGVETGSGLQEKHVPETHVIPLLFYSAYLNMPFHIFGTDYATPDGTCLRDYVHVSDIARAHCKALEHLKEGHPSDVFNLGTGKGASVKELIQVVQEVTQKEIQVKEGQRRKGDPERLVADPFKASHILQWKPFYTDLSCGVASLL